ncbi:MAG: hypothetical protein L0Y80_08215 [Ignavibacteriae bacterium]|nr:hypothetical protein [Ignavibacteriota bacterium]
MVIPVTFLKVFCSGVFPLEAYLEANLETFHVRIFFEKLLCLAHSCFDDEGVKIFPFLAPEILAQSFDGYVKMFGDICERVNAADISFDPFFDVGGIYAHNLLQ